MIDGYHRQHPDAVMSQAAAQALSGRGHEVDRLCVADFNFVMSARERTEYHGDQPVISDDVVDSVNRLRAADAMLFCYPSVAFTVPAATKGWLERVLVPGVGFVFDDQHRIRPGMTNIRRIGALTTSPHGRWARFRARDAGKRTTARTLRLSCHKRCRITFLCLPSPAPNTVAEQVGHALRRW